MTPSGRSGPASRRGVLIVEDELSLGRLLQRVLEEEGFAAGVARDGRAGLERVLSELPDAVILDLSLPEMDGVEVCRRVREAGLMMPIVMLTARDAVSDRVCGLESGADDYMVKPFATEELLARLRAHLRRGSNGGRRLRILDLVLDPDQHRVWRRGGEVTLTTQEFRLLELLMRHPNQVLTRQRILDRVWGYQATPASNVVDIYIHYLRDKIDRDSQRKLIRTVRSVGYVLRP